MMPHSFLFGHLHIIYRLIKELPRDLHGNYVPYILMQNWRTLYPEEKTCPGLFYVDLWPIGPPTIFTIDPAFPTQSLFDLKQLKHHGSILSYLKPLTQNLDIVSATGKQWRTWRTWLSYGFAPKNINSLVPIMLDEVVIFRDKLISLAGKDNNNHSWGKVFQLEHVTTNLSFDIIARASLDLRLNEQLEKPSLLRRAMADQLDQMLLEYNIFSLPQILSPMRQWRIFRNTRNMRKALLPAVTAIINRPFSPENRTILDLTVQAMRRDGKLAAPDPKSESRKEEVEVDPFLIDTILAQLKAFIFAGHDTTAVTICWLLHSLTHFPDAAAKVRAELDDVLGTERGTASLQKLRETPHLVNSLVYLNAFMKETLRMYPSAAAFRVSSGDFVFHHPRDNRVYPTKGFMIADAVIAGMKYEGAWVRPDEFLPERWLAQEGEELHVKKNAWRPFGLGPRQCIGQELAMMQMKLVLAAVAREVDVDCAWDEWDALR